jgi:hypothetical protein
MSDIHQTLCFLLLIISLGGCFMWALWEREAGRQLRFRRKQLVNQAMRTVLTSGEGGEPSHTVELASEKG